MFNFRKKSNELANVEGETTRQRFIRLTAKWYGKDSLEYRTIYQMGQNKTREGLHKMSEAFAIFKEEHYC